MTLLTLLELRGVHKEKQFRTYEHDTHLKNKRKEKTINARDYFLYADHSFN